MTQAARVYGESMYALALEEGLTGEILEEMKVIRTLFQENPCLLYTSPAAEPIQTVSVGRIKCFRLPAP